MNVLSLRIDRIIDKLLLFCFVLLNGIAGFGQTLPTTSQTDWPASSGSWLVPAGVYSITVKCYGGGGGGGGAGNSGAGSGGGGGAFASDLTPLNVTPGQTIVVIVGNGGNAGNNGPGGAGGLSSVSYNSTIYVRAAGGNAGVGGTAATTTGGTGGLIASSIGSIKYAGGNGGNGATGTWDNGGGGGGGAGTSGNGGNGVSASGSSTIPAGGAGGAAGGGNGGTGTAFNNNGFRVGGNGLSYGGGGGGGCAYNASGGNGGTGANGAVLISYTVCPLAITAQPSTTVQNICLNGVSTPISVTATGSPSYQWYSNSISSNTGGTLISGATGASYTPPTNTSGTKYYYCVLSGTCTITTNVSGAVNVNVAGITPSGTTNICQGGNVTLTASASGATSYLWSNGETTSSISVSPTSTTVYTVSINGSCGVLNGQITVNVSPLLNLTATVSGSNIWNAVGSVQTVNLNAFPISGAVILSEGFNNSQCVGSNTFGTISPTCANGLSTTWSLPSGNWVAAVNTTAIDYGTCTDPAPILTTTASDGFMYGGTISPWEGSRLVSFNSSRTKGGNFATLTSPSFSTIGYTGVMVDFYMLMLVTNALNGERIELSYSTDGTTFTNFSPNYARKPWNCNAWEQFSCQLPNAAANQPNVWIRFRFISGQNCDSGGTAGNNLDIDMVRITGTTAPGGYGFYSYQWQEYNTPVLGIVNPNAQSTTTVNYTGTATGSKYWTCTITDAYGCVSTATTGFVNLNVQSNASSGAGTILASPTTVCPGGGSTLSFTQSGAGNIQWESSTTSATAGFDPISGATSATYNATNITQTTWYRVRLTGMSMSNGLCAPPNFYSTVAVVTVTTFNNGTIQNTGESVGCGGDPAQFSFTTLPSGSGTYSVQWYAFDGSTAAPTGSTVPSGWNAVGGPVSPTVTVMPTQTFSAAGLPAGWAFGTTPATITTTCGGAANNAINFNNTSPWGQSVISEVYAAPVTSLSFVHGASGCCSRTSTLTVEAWNGSSWTLVSGGTVSQSSGGTGGCNSSVKSFSFSSALNYTQFRVTRTAGTATKVTVDDWNVTTTTNITYDPPAGASSTTMYAAYVTFTGGTCTSNGWATNSWTVNFTGGGTSTDWTGAALDWNWFNSANWSCGIPACGIDANIPVVGNNTYPRIDNAIATGAACKTITIDPSASLETIGSANLDVCGNWVKNGTYTYNIGKISMVGTVAQTMSPATSFYNLTINNTGAGVTISADQTVTNVLTLIDGVVTTAANRMIISNSSPANVINGGANPTNYTNSWINGNIRRAFAQNTGVYDFPVGTAGFAALARLTNANIDGITTFNARFDAPLSSVAPLDPLIALDLGTPYTACFGDGHWDITPTTTLTGGSYNLQLYFNGFTSMNASYDNKFGIVKRPSGSSNSMLWSTSMPVEGAGVISAANGAGRIYANGYAMRTGMNKFSDFAIAFAMAPLPSNSSLSLVNVKTAKNISTGQLPLRITTISSRLNIVEMAVIFTRCR
jgi:hypothetical protein